MKRPLHNAELALGAPQACKSALHEADIIHMCVAPPPSKMAATLLSQLPQTHLRGPAPDRSVTRVSKRSQPAIRNGYRCTHGAPSTTASLPTMPVAPTISQHPSPAGTSTCAAAQALLGARFSASTLAGPPHSLVPQARRGARGPRPLAVLVSQRNLAAVMASAAWDAQLAHRDVGLTDAHMQDTAGAQAHVGNIEPAQGRTERTGAQPAGGGGGGGGGHDSLPSAQTSPDAPPVPPPLHDPAPGGHGVFATVASIAMYDGFTPGDNVICGTPNTASGATAYGSLAYATYGAAQAVDCTTAAYGNQAIGFGAAAYGNQATGSGAAAYGPLATPVYDAQAFGGNSLYGAAQAVDCTTAAYGNQAIGFGAATYGNQATGSGAAAYGPLAPSATPVYDAQASGGNSLYGAAQAVDCTTAAYGNQVAGSGAAAYGIQDVDVTTVYDHRSISGRPMCRLHATASAQAAANALACLEGGSRGNGNPQLGMDAGLKTRPGVNTPPAPKGLGEVPPEGEAVAATAVTAAAASPMSPCGGEANSAWSAAADDIGCYLADGVSTAPPAPRPPPSSGQPAARLNCAMDGGARCGSGGGAAAASGASRAESSSSTLTQLLLHQQPCGDAFRGTVYMDLDATAAGVEVDPLMDALSELHDELFGCC